MQQYNGFVYLWFDKDKKMFYLGSHFGDTKDGYVGSGVRFIRAYNKRPTAFRRRILEYVIGDKNNILEKEQEWLNLIDDNELHSKYYNQKKFASGGSVAGRKQPKTEEHIQKLRKPRKDTSRMKWHKSEITKRKMSEAKKGVNHSKELNPMFGKMHSYESRILISQMAQKREKATCPHCLRDALPSHYSRYHGENCKLYQFS